MMVPGIGDRYLATRVLLGCGAVGIGLLTIYLVLALVDESSSSSGWSDALRDALLGMPSTIQRLLPAITLLGGSLALSASARHHELIVLRGAGLSPLRLARGPIIAGLLIGALGLANANWLLPLAGAQNGYSGDALWVPMGDAVVHIDGLGSDNQVRGVSIYRFTADGLSQVLRAERAQFGSDGHWQLQKVEQISFDDNGMRRDFLADLATDDLPQPQVLRLQGLERGAVGLGDLIRYVGYRRQQSVPSIEAEVRLAALLVQPFLLIALLTLVTTGLAAHASRTGIAGRIGLLVGVGLAASVAQDLLGALAQLQRWPPLPSVAAVPVAVLLLAIVTPRLLR